MCGHLPGLPVRGLQKGACSQTPPVSIGGDGGPVFAPLGHRCGRLTKKAIDSMSGRSIKYTNALVNGNIDFRPFPGSGGWRENAAGL